MTFLCRRADLAATGAKGVTLDDGREIVVVETPAGARRKVRASWRPNSQPGSTDRCALAQSRHRSKPRD